MNDFGILFFLFGVILLVVALLAAVIGYFWASSRIKSDLLTQMNKQGDSIRKDAQVQLQNWKNQELALVRQQTFEAARGQAIQEMQEQMRAWQDHQLQQIRKQLAEAIRGEAIREAQDQLMKWRNEELESSKTQMWEVLHKEAALSLEQWRVEAEKEIRQDAISKSQSVTMGKMTEHFVPYLPGFGYNPRDARFIGSPIDLVIFDGLDEGYVRKIVFAEIKTGVSSLSTRERWVRDAILARNIEWLEIKANLEGPEVIQKVVPKRFFGGQS